MLKRLSPVRATGSPRGAPLARPRITDIGQSGQKPERESATMIVDKSVSVSPLEQVLMALSARGSGLTRRNDGGEPGKAAEEERRTKEQRAHSGETRG